MREETVRCVAQPGDIEDAGAYGVHVHGFEADKPQKKGTDGIATRSRSLKMHSYGVLF